MNTKPLSDEELCALATRAEYEPETLTASEIQELALATLPDFQPETPLNSQN